MAYKCTRTCYNKGQSYYEDVVYDSIGDTMPKFFEEIEAGESEVVETGLPDTREEVRAALDELGVDYNGRLGLAKLQALLEEAQNDALTS